MFKNKRFMLIFFILLVISAACSKSEDIVLDMPGTVQNNDIQTNDINTTEQNNEEVATLEEVEREAGSDYIFPIEGIRPYAVMIDNEGTMSLPQGGIDKAQIVYEIVVEGGETRLMPLFWGNDPEMIGPIRSSRHYFLDYIMEHDAIYVHFGWSPMAKRDISAFKINNINGVSNGGEIFWDITKDKYNWQDSYTSMENIIKYVEKAKYRTNTDKDIVFKYSESSNELEDGIKAEKINIEYSYSYTCAYEYDHSTNSYKRRRKGKPHIERVTGRQLEAMNIIIQNVRNYTIKGDDAGRQEVDTVGKGDGWFITHGKAIKITWQKKSRSSATQYFDQNGKEILLNAGQTWIQIVPLYGKVEIE